MRTIPLIGLILALLLSLALGYVLWTWESGEDREFTENMDRIKTLQKLNTHWSLAALQSYSEPLSNFDQMAELLPKIREAKQALLDSELNSDQMPRSLSGVLQAYLSYFDSKEKDIERFKSYYAIVRNSAIYLPQVEHQLIREATQAGLSDLVKEVETIQQEITNFMKQPNSGLAMVLETRINSLLEKESAYPEAVAATLREYAAHVQVLLKYKIPLEKLLARITDSRIDEASLELFSLYQAYENSTQGEISMEQQILMIAIASTGLFLLFSIVMLLDRGTGPGYRR